MPLPRIASMPGDKKRPSAGDFVVCEKKRKYSDFKKAADALSCRVYRCPVCGFFHRATKKEYKK